MSVQNLSVELPNVGPGPNPCSLTDLGEANDFVVVLLQRDHYCPNCRMQVNEVADRYEAFRARGAEVVSVVPEPLERVRKWQDSYDLPFPLLADPETDAGKSFDKPVKFGPLGKLSDFVGRMPQAAVVDTRGEATVEWVYRGSSTFGRPGADELLAQVDRLRK